MLKSEFDFVLNVPIDYTSKSGTIESAKQIALSAPTVAQDALRIKLKQGFTQSLFALSQSAKPSESKSDDGDPDGESIIMLLYASNLDLVAYKNTFKELVISGAGTVGDMPITAAIYDRIDPNDADRLLGEYLANFMKLSAPTTKKRKSNT
jgi:hypothetical protein